ncbi:KPN_02809 family neutral zinc metallopeptidase [Aeromicrobium duanguangcaii]|uniref:KPN_02809 family neutral zinc metallopeptidase n=1 Tax=Aeromicrobium duanguangcaii TaxID=2968086 RepID=UPI0020172C4E|nr:neutral zinc metallopeptidase [Aeromicrobium duanguangcaii]MCL3837239.1 neutral zinc metallopeptidase [Aeromicrobium duanguangcaii]
MTFNEGANLDTSQVIGGKSGAVVGGGVGGLLLVLLFAFLGGNPLGGGSSSAFDVNQVLTGGSNSSAIDVSQCKTGADANENDVCRIVGTVNSAQDYWTDALPADINRQYREAPTVIYSGSTQSACGTASNQTGPFYCPSDERVYIDASFFDQLSSQYGADGGNLAQMYVVAHEYGHHVQNILGILAKAQDGKAGPRSNGVRVELMADCFAGVWAHHAASTQDDQGNTLIKPLTRKDIDSALSAAAAVGDDHIQAELGGGRVNQDSWTHGSSESRQRWFTAGYESGNLNSCDTFATNEL